MKVDVIIVQLGRKWWNILGIFSSVLGLAVCLVLTVFGTITTYDHYVRHVYNVTLLQFPTWIVLLCIPVGSLFLTIRFSRRAFGFLESLRSTHSYGGGIS